MSTAVDSPPKPDAPTIMQVKILFWGPGEAGKTTTYQRLMEIFKHFQVSKGISIATTDDRTLWNDSVHFKFPMIPGKLIIVLNIATTTGQERFLATREYILQNADGVVFVADSSWGKMEENLRSFEELRHFTQANHTPIIIQLNKRDLPDAIGLLDFLMRMDLPISNKTFGGLQLVYETVANSRQTVDKNIIRKMIIGLLEAVIRKNLFTNYG